MDKLHIDLNQLFAGIAGAIAGTDWPKVKTVFQGLLTVFVGAMSAIYLTPIVAHRIGWETPQEMVGLSFLLGTLGLRTVQTMNTVIEQKLSKMGAAQ